MNGRSTAHRFLLWSTLISTCGYAFHESRFRDLLKRRSKKSNRTSVRSRNLDDVVVNYVDQPIDHFRDDTTVNATLKQRYFYSARFASSEGGGVDALPTYAFLCCGGEGPALDESVLVDSVHCTGDMLELAKYLHENNMAKVHIYALEHRYYGESYPTFFDGAGRKVPALARENLRFLSSRQALADLAGFVTDQKESGLPAETKWVTFGGSYPGWIAAYARVVYPNLIWAAVSSSAPIHPTVNFPGYKERQAWDLQYGRIGGTDDCLDIVQTGHQQVMDLYETGNYSMISELFRLCDPNALQTKRNFEMLVGDGLVNIPAQGNDPSCAKGPVCNLNKVCLMLTNSVTIETELMALAQLAHLQEADDECIEVSWADFLDYLNSTEIDAEGERSWLYQTCTEFGYYQTCDTNSLCPFGRGYHALDMDYEICERAFGLDRVTVDANVAATRDHYGLPSDQGATRILSMNGDVDPWSVLAMTSSSDPDNLPTHWVRGSSHHFWTHKVKPATDGDEIQSARKLIYDTVVQWLMEDDNKGSMDVSSVFLDTRSH